MSKNERMVGISRRTLVKSTAIGSLALAAGSFSLPFTLRSAAACSAAIFFAQKRDKFCTVGRCQKDTFCTVQK